MDRFIHLGLAAAMPGGGRTAGLPTGDALADELAVRIGCNIGSGIGGLPMIEETHGELVNRGPRRISPFFVPASIINMISGHVSIKYGFKGPNIAVVTACTTGLHAIGTVGAHDRVRRCRRDDRRRRRIDASRRWASAASPRRARCPPATTIPTTASRPWDKDRDGFVLGEGAGVLVLEEYEHAKARGAKIYAEVAGFGMSADAYHMTAPDVDGPRRAMVNGACAMPASTPTRSHYLNAHGTSTPLGDLNETNAIKAGFRRPREEAGGELHQVDDRPPAGRRRRHRVGVHRAGGAPPEEPADHQHLQPGSGVRPGLLRQRRRAT